MELPQAPSPRARSLEVIGEQTHDTTTISLAVVNFGLHERRMQLSRRATATGWIRLLSCISRTRPKLEAKLNALAER